MTGQTGEFHSPCYPDHYDNDLYCCWSIDVDPAHVIQLEVIGYSLESGYDYLYVSM